MRMDRRAVPSARGYGREHTDGFGRQGPGGYGGVRGRGAMFGMNGNNWSQGGSRPGDWICPKCGNKNFSRRVVCNISTCKEPKPEGGGGADRYNPYSTSVNGRGRGRRGPQEKREGDWNCPKCNNMNFAWRSQCNSHGCDQKREDVEQTEES